MQQKIEEILQRTPGLKARVIANQVGVDTKDVNVLLYGNRGVFTVDAEFRWSLVDLVELRIELPEDSWVNCDSFEQALRNAGSPIDATCTSVVFCAPKGCKIKLDAAARLMALCNQLAWMQKSKAVSIDFTNCPTTLRYLDRMGFFDHLASEVSILPKRPKISGAMTYRGNNDKVVEFGAIDPVNPDEDIPRQLKISFVAHAGDEKYSHPAFTVLSELFNNVRDHSKSPIPGFVALQCYKKGPKPHIQTVISDSGIGIIGTLLPILKDRYPQLAERLEANRVAGAHLLKEVFQYGGISQSTDDGRGIGLKRSGDIAARFSANIAVRQENLEVKLRYRNGKLDAFRYLIDMPRILGTHICFDFFLDGT